LRVLGGGSMTACFRIAPALLLAMVGTPMAHGQITIAVNDYTGVSKPVMAMAVDYAQRVLERAGIATTWSICRRPDTVPGDCTRPLPPEHQFVAVLVMPRDSSRTEAAPVNGDSMGLAITGTEAALQPRAWAFFDSVELLAAKTKRPLSLVLSCVLLHEVAHVLGVGHGDSGIMRASMGATEVGNAAGGLAFDASVMRLLQAGATRLANRWGVVQVAARR
jgi:hypothetical protein